MSGRSIASQRPWQTVHSGREAAMLRRGRRRQARAWSEDRGSSAPWPHPHRTLQVNVIVRMTR
jgi:hypothetical protein